LGERTAVFTLKFGTKWQPVVSFTLRPPYRRRRESAVCKRKLDGSCSRYGRL